MSEVTTETSTTADIAEYSRLCTTEQTSLEEDEANFTNIILYISIPVCIIIIVVITVIFIIIIIIIKKAKKSREELGSSSADHYFFSFNALPRSPTRGISKTEEYNWK